MIIDLSTVVLSAGVGGAAGAFVKEVTEHGVDWLIELVASHSEDVQAAAQENARRFLIRLAQRVERLEAELPVDGKQILDNALSDPGTSLVMRRALVSAAATNSDDRHQILADLIAQRLNADPDDLVALAGGAACDVVCALTTRQMNLLALAVRIYDIRPIADGPLRTPDQAAYDQDVLKWWEPLDALVRNCVGVSRMDFRHLDAMSCIYTRSFRADLLAVLSLINEPPFKLSPADLQRQPWWPDLNNIWELGLGNAYATSIGGMVGTMRHDMVVNLKTQIRW